MSARTLLVAALAIGNIIVSGQSCYESCTRSNDKNCDAKVSYSSCYVKYCPGPLPTNVAGDVSLYCSPPVISDGGVEMAPPEGPASISASTTMVTKTMITSTMVTEGQAPSTGSAAKQNSGSDSSDGLGQPAKILIGIGAGVGGVLAASLAFLLVKAGAFARAGARRVVGSSVAALGPGLASDPVFAASGAPIGDISMEEKMGFYGYTPGGSLESLASSPPEYPHTGAGAGFSNSGLTGRDSTNQAKANSCGCPEIIEGANCSAPRTGMEPTGTKEANFTTPGNPAEESTGLYGEGLGVSPVGIPLPTAATPCKGESG